MHETDRTEIVLDAPNKRCYSKDVHIMCHFAGVLCIGLIQKGGGNADGKNKKRTGT